MEDIQHDTGSESGPHKYIEETSECYYEVAASIGVTAKVRVRAYNYDKYGNRQYSNWSVQKTVKIRGGYVPQDLSDASINSNPQPAMYRVRNKNYDESSQIGAFENIENAKRAAREHPGYCVFDMSGNLIYEP